MNSLRTPLLGRNVSDTEDAKSQPNVTGINENAFSAFYHPIELTIINDELDEAKLKEEIPLGERRALAVANFLAPTSTAAGLTYGVMLKLFAPITAGGASIAVSSTVFIGLTCGAGVIAILMGIVIYSKLYKEALKDTMKFIKRSKAYDDKIAEKENLIREDKINSFRLLLQMKHALQNVKEEKERQTIKERMEIFIDYLGCTGKKTLLDELEKAYTAVIVNKTQDLRSYLEENKDTILEPFPGIPQQLNTPVSYKKPYALATLSGIIATAGAFSLSYVLYGVIIGLAAFNPFTAPIVLIGVTAALIGFGIGYAVLKIKKANAEREVELNQKKLHLGQVDLVSERLAKANIKELHSLIEHYQEKTIALDKQVADLQAKVNLPPEKDMKLHMTQTISHHKIEEKSRENLQKQGLDLRDQLERLMEQEKAYKKKIEELEKQVSMLQEKIAKKDHIITEQQQEIQKLKAIATPHEPREQKRMSKTIALPRSNSSPALFKPSGAALPSAISSAKDNSHTPG